MEEDLIFKAILDNTPESFVLISPNHKVLAFNTSIQKQLLNLVKKNIEIGDDYRDFVVNPLKELYEDSFSKALNGEYTDVQIETPGESFSIWFEYKMNPVYKPTGELLG